MKNGLLSPFHLGVSSRETFSRSWNHGRVWHPQPHGVKYYKVHIQTLNCTWPQRSAWSLNSLARGYSSISRIVSSRAFHDRCSAAIPAASPSLRCPSGLTWSVSSGSSTGSRSPPQAQPANDIERDTWSMSTALIPVSSGMTFFCLSQNSRGFAVPIFTPSCLVRCWAASFLHSPTGNLYTAYVFVSGGVDRATQVFRVDTWRAPSIPL